MMTRSLLLCILITLQMALAQPSRAEIEKQYSDSLASLVTIHQKISGIHAYVAALQPIAIARANHFFLFKFDKTANRYLLVDDGPIPYPIYKGVRAAMPIALNQWQPACVLSSEVFQKRADYAVIFHEFVHCAQWDDAELALKDKLPIYQEAMVNQNYSWEVDFEFPYTEVSARYHAFHQAIESGDVAAIAMTRAELKSGLSPRDYQYMAWAEWKEGFARLIENKIRLVLKLPQVTSDANHPFSRVTFYSTGAAYIDYLISREPDLFNNQTELFYRIYGQNL